MRISYVLSDFNILEITKLDQLSQARETCDRLVLGLVNDQDFEAITGTPPLNCLADRLDLVSMLRNVDQVFPHYASSMLQFSAEDDVRYFITDEAFRRLMNVKSTVIEPRRFSRSRFVTPLRSVEETLAVSHLAVS